MLLSKSETHLPCSRWKASWKSPLLRASKVKIDSLKIFKQNFKHLGPPLYAFLSIRFRALFPSIRPNTVSKPYTGKLFWHISAWTYLAHIWPVFQYTVLGCFQHSFNKLWVFWGTAFFRPEMDCFLYIRPNYLGFRASHPPTGPPLNQCSRPYSATSQKSRRTPVFGQQSQSDKKNGYPGTFISFH